MKNDTNMPKIGFKSSFLILGVTFIVLFAVPFLLERFSPGIQWLVLILSSLLIGATIAYACCFIETEKRIGSSFWVLLGISSLFIFIIEFFLFGLGIYL